MSQIGLDALVVDGDSRSLQMLADILVQEGFTTRCAGTLAEARQALRKWMPRLIVAEHVLPDGNGTKLLSKLRRLEKLGRHTTTAVIIITAYSTVDSAVEALRLGAFEYLSKPIDVSKLQAVLARVARLPDEEEKFARMRAELHDHRR